LDGLPERTPSNILRIHGAKNAPEGTPLKRKSLMLLFGDFLKIPGAK
jgi:hypothetical protein